MTIVSDFTSAWSSSVTLAANEFWQVKIGPVLIATGAGTAPSELDDGLLLDAGDILALSNGDVVRYRSARADNGGRVARMTRV